MIPSLFWDFMRRRIGVTYFLTDVSGQPGSLNVGNNYHSTFRRIPKGRRSQWDGFLSEHFHFHLLLFNILASTIWGEGTRWRSWLKHCAASQKVAGPIPDGVIGIFH